MDARDPSEELYERARQYWLFHDASTSGDREQRIRAERGDLGQAFGVAFDLTQDEAQREDFLIALIDTRRNDAWDLSILGAGFVEDVEHDGDPDILAKLRHRGVPAAVIAAINASVWR